MKSKFHIPANNSISTVPPSTGFKSKSATQTSFRFNPVSNPNRSQQLTRGTFMSKAQSKFDSVIDQGFGITTDTTSLDQKRPQTLDIR